MGTEYYLVNPDKKEVYALGRHLSNFSEIKQWCFSGKADYIGYECWYDFWTDLLLNNSEFLDFNLTFNEFFELAGQIYKWCSGQKIYLDSDISSNNEWINFKETGSVYDFFESHHSFEEQTEELVFSLIPSEYWVKDEDKVLQTLDTLCNYIKEKEECNKATK